MIHQTVVIGSGDDEFFHGFDKMVHHFVVTTQQFLAVGDGRQKVIQDRHEEVHDHDDHREQVHHQEESGGHSTVLHYCVQAELSQHCFNLYTTYGMIRQYIASS